MDAQSIESPQDSHYLECIYFFSLERIKKNFSFDWTLNWIRINYL